MIRTNRDSNNVNSNDAETLVEGAGLWWNEFHKARQLEELYESSKRCMNCGTSFCQMGLPIQGVGSGCPLNNLIPEFISLFNQNRLYEAYNRLRLTNNFPEFTSRVCPALCQGSCTNGLNTEPVRVKDIEAYIIEEAFNRGWVKPFEPLLRTGKKIAVIGSGPAGLAAADQLNQAGHSVTVFERDDRIGGLMLYGIPNMKLDKSILKRRLDILAAEGIEFITNTTIGVTLTTEELETRFDAILIAAGATKARLLEIPGSEYKGIYKAMDYLKAATKNLLDSNNKEPVPIDAKDKHVVILGGGDTGTDCMATAIRQGCKSIQQLEIMPQLPEERAKTNPWPQFPKLRKVDYGHKEAIQKFGSDPRSYCKKTIRFDSTNGETVSSLTHVLVQWERNSEGHLIPTDKPNTEATIKADMVLLALGFPGPEPELLDKLGVNKTNRTTVETKPGDFQTNKEKVFVAGDSRTGQSLVAWAMKDGRAAARKIDAFLMGDTLLPE